MGKNRLLRQEQIRRYIISEGEVSLEDLCNRFSVSEATIRRSLRELEDRGLILRTRGGASRTHPNIPEPPVFHRATEMSEQKDAIARVAADLVGDGDIIFLGSGSTVYTVAQHLKSRQNLTIISNSLPIINLFSNMPNISVIVLGGLLRNSELSMIGHLTEHAVKELRADKVIAGIQAIDPDVGLANNYLPETVTDRAIMQMAQKVIIVADHSKFGKVATSFVAPFSHIITIITDWEVDKTITKQIEDIGVKIIIAPNSD